MHKINFFRISCLLLFAVLTFSVNESLSRDTDIYKISTKQNCYTLMDNSGSMDFGVYEHTVDYGEMFDYLYCLDADDGQTACGNQYIYDTINKSNYFYQNHHERRKIYLWKGEIGVTLANVDGETMAFTGDAADPAYLWYTNDLYDTHTMIDSTGNLSDDGTGLQRITLDADNHILLDGNRLPLGQDITLHDFIELYDGSIVDNGFGGLLNAPGYYFSGYEGVTQGSLDAAENGDSDIYFFLTGNWANMQAMYNLHYVTNNPNPTGAATDDPAWKFEVVPVTASSWSELSYDLDYPQGSGNYENKLSESDSMQMVTHPGATQIQVHFSSFDVEGDGSSGSWSHDYLVIKDSSGNDIAQYDNDNSPANDWSITVNGDTVQLCIDSDNDTTGTGYTIDKIRVSYQDSSYLMQNRMDVAKDAMLYTLDEFYGKMNWGFATYKSGDGATLHHSLNPNETDDVNSNSVRNAVEKLSPGGGTPIGEALQDVFEQGYYIKRHSLDNLDCRKNYIISLSDGYPSDDEDWSRIGGKTFTDEDGDGWTADPYQYTTPPPNYYDDVAHWMYTHSWQDDNKGEVADPANSYENVITHHIAFGAKQPLMMDAAGESGGEYITAYNKSQLVAAFYALSLQITDAVSFTSPVVSVDAANKIQNGNDLYLGLFLPKDSTSWVGNIKKFRFGYKTGEDPWMIYDADDNEAVNSNGEFLDNTAGFWGDDNDPNDSDNYGAADVTEDGVGEVLLERIQDDFVSSSFYERNIKTYDTANELLVDIDSLIAADLDVADSHARNKLINYLYGYTHDADAATGNPLAVRGWTLGSIIHSRPVVIDYYDSSGDLDNRYVVVGANDGMLHVFNDEDGKEELAFIPPDLLPKLKNLPVESLFDTVDGLISLFRKNNVPKYLVFGERRGGNRYWCLNIEDNNPANWTVQWEYNNPEISQSWAEPKFATVATGLSNTSTGEIGFKDVMIVTGGYDAEEDNYPEPFEDVNYNGIPDNQEWDKNDPTQDINGNGVYDTQNLGQNETGRGIFVINIEDPADEVYAVSYDASGSDIEKNMIWCFPATPSVVTNTYSYFAEESGNIVEKRKTNVLKAIYAVDVYANVYKISFDFDTEYNSTSESFSAAPAASADRWAVEKIFSANPSAGSNVVNAGGTFTKGSDSDDLGLKAFYGPAVSLGGACSFFDAGNYYFEDTTFTGTDGIASIFFGTGDREHPIYAMKKNRVYAVYDDSSVTAVDDLSGSSVIVSSVPYKEAHLIDLTLDQLDKDTVLTGTPSKEDYRIALTDNPYFDSSGTSQLENGTNEDDAKGWYIILDGQEDTGHYWEKVLSRIQLFAGILYFTTYESDISDICNPNGNGLAYSINYCDATAAYDLNPLNNTSSDPDDPPTLDVSDRYHKVVNIFGIPSGFSIVIRDGKAGAMAMMGGKMIGPKGGNDYTIKYPGTGLNLYYWLEGKTF